MGPELTFSITKNKISDELSYNSLGVYHLHLTFHIANLNVGRLKLVWIMV